MGSTSKSDSTRFGIRLDARVVTFMICLFISVFFWLLMTLAKDYTMTVRFPVNYINLPMDKVISNTLPETIDIEIRARGFNLLAYKLKKKHEVIDVDMRDVRALNSKNVYYLLSNSRSDKIRAQFNNDIHVVKISPDTIFVNFNKKVSKSVPVKFYLSPVFNKQYNLTDSISIQPQYITVSGEAEVIDKIDTVKTQHVLLKNIDRSMIVKLPLIKTAAQKNVEFSQPYVNASVKVTKFTEVSVELPVEVENLPIGYTFKTFPDKVLVKFNVAFENYEKINTLNFRAIVDYKKIDQESNKLKVQLVKFPEGIRNVKLVTEKVEYIISK
ncbi:MAG TPA: CdaR family protein [Bacteroidia bacterium]|nr:CdaR family protein [Bacteroidia bacterium]